MSLLETTNHGPINNLPVHNAIHVFFFLLTYSIIQLYQQDHYPRASNVHIGDITLDAAKEKLSLNPKRKISLTETETCSINKISFWELGIAHMPEGRRLFSRLSVMQNLTLGAYTKVDQRLKEGTLERIFSLIRN